MNEKNIIILVFLSLGLIVFPLAIFFHMNLYADGCYFFASMAETGKIATAAPTFSRLGGYWVRQAPTVIAMHFGVSDLSVLARIYGACLYYMPFVCYALATYLLFRKGLKTQATILSIMYLLIVYFASYFIITESHYATGLFVLSLAILTTCDLGKWSTLLSLMSLGILALFSYEFWALFYPVCLLFLLWKVPKRDTSHLVRSGHVSLLLLYVAGAIVNIAGIVVFVAPAQRDSMFTRHLQDVWPMVLGACLIMGIVQCWACFGDAIIRLLRIENMFGKLRKKSSFTNAEVMFIVSFLITFTALVLTCFLRIPMVPKAYALRSLNLFLPLMFVLSLVPFAEKRANAKAARSIAICCLLPILIVTVQGNTSTTLKWSGFTNSMFKQSQNLSGYVSVNNVGFENRDLLWGWTSPILSILLQTMQGRDVKTVFYNPTAAWEPMGPHERERAKKFTAKIGGNFGL